VHGEVEPADLLLFGDPVGWRFFTGGGLILGSALLFQLEHLLNGRKPKGVLARGGAADGPVPKSATTR